MTRYVNTFFRYLWLLVIPVIAVAVAALFLFRPSYTSIANLWVEQPLFVQQQRTTQGSAWESPAAQVADLLKELMATQSFVTQVVHDSPTLAATLHTDAERENAVTLVAHNLKVDSSSWHLISLSYTGDNSAASLEVMTAIVSHLTTYYNDNVVTQAQETITYQQAQVTAASTALDTATSALTTFIQQHPNIAAVDVMTKTTVTADDVAYASLTQNRDAARKKYDDAKAALTTTQDQFTAYQKGLDLTLVVQDKPEIFAASSGRLRPALLSGGIGLGVGLALVLAIIALLTLFDGRLRDVDDVRRALRMDKVLSLTDAAPSRRRPARTRVRRRLAVRLPRLAPGMGRQATPVKARA